MDETFGKYLISQDKNKMDSNRVLELLRTTYWATERSLDTMEKAMENSICCGVYDQDGYLVAFSRVLTDFATTYYLADVVVDERYRGNGIGKEMINHVCKDEQLQNMRGLLITKDAHGLYEKYGFSREGAQWFMTTKYGRIL